MALRQRLNPQTRQRSSIAVLHSALRTFLSEANAAASMAARARESAADAVENCGAAAPIVSTRSSRAAASRAASSIKDAADALARSVAVETAVSHALLTASALAGKLGVGTEVSVDESASMVLGDVRGGKGSVGILDLPGGVVEQIFDFLSHSRGESPRKFPCKPQVYRFAFSCRQLSSIFRESYVKVLYFFAGVQLSRDARIYYDAVSGALGRFSAAEKVVIEGSACLAQSAVETIQGKHFPVGDSLVEYRLALVSRKLISTAVSGSASDSSGANVREVHFNSGGKGVPPGEVCKEVVSVDSLFFPWQETGWQWLDCFPNATYAVFEDLSASLTATRLCGRESVASLKTVGLSLCDFVGEPCWPLPLSIEYHRFGIAHELARFYNIEQLIFHQMPSTELKAFDITTVVQVLPKLRDLGLTFHLFEENEGRPFLKKVLRNLASPDDRQLRVTVRALDWKEEFRERYEAEPGWIFTKTDSDLNILAVEEFKSIIVGELHELWDVTEVFSDCLLGRRSSNDLTVVASFRSQ